MRQWQRNGEACKQAALPGQLGCYWRLRSRSTAGSPNIGAHPSDTAMSPPKRLPCCADRGLCAAAWAASPPGPSPASPPSRDPGCLWHRGLPRRRRPGRRLSRRSRCAGGRVGAGCCRQSRSFGAPGGRTQSLLVGPAHPGAACERLEKIVLPTLSSCDKLTKGLPRVAERPEAHVAYRARRQGAACYLLVSDRA